MQKLVLLFCLLIITELLAAQQQGLNFTSADINRIEKGALYNYHFEAKDSAGNSITYTVKKLPSWLSYNADAQTISGKAVKAGQYLLQLTATTKTDTAQQNFMITVYDAQTTNILCIGNSITNGTSAFNSYRRALWQILHAGNYNFDLIGSWDKHHGGGEFPNPDFDMDHDGHSGWNAQDIFTPPSWDSVRGNLPAWLQTYKPDIVLMELGTNDVFQCRNADDVIKNLSEAIGVLRSKNNKVKIVIAQIPPLGLQWSDKKLCGDSVDYATRITELNNAIATFGKKMNVVVVDQFTGIDPAKDMYDDIHPNNAGEKIMAERWFNAIHTYIKTF